MFICSIGYKNSIFVVDILTMLFLLHRKLKGLDFTIYIAWILPFLQILISSEFYFLQHIKSSNEAVWYKISNVPVFFTKHADYTCIKRSCNFFYYYFFYSSNIQGTVLCLRMKMPDLSMKLCQI